MGERKLTEPFRESGDWYLPNNKENSLSGELIYEPGESLRLELVGRFRRDPNEAFNLESVPTILGELSNQYVTLYQCERTNLSVNIPGKGRSVFQPRFALFGAHDKSLEQPAARRTDQVEKPRERLRCPNRTGPGRWPGTNPG